MNVEPGRWLLDTCLPRDGYTGMDVVHASDLSGVTGASVLSEATRLSRTLVTCMQVSRGPWATAFEQAAVVVFEEAPASATEIERNLRHLEFRIGQYEGGLQLAGNRFLIRADREILIVGPTGRETALEPWQEVHMKQASATKVAALAV
jgi:hypothetical protein